MNIKSYDEWNKQGIMNWPNEMIEMFLSWTNERNIYIKHPVPPLKEESANEAPAACGGTAPEQQVNAEICPHYFEATDGVHVVIVGQCDCKGKVSAARKAEN